MASLLRAWLRDATTNVFRKPHPEDKKPPPEPEPFKSQREFERDYGHIKGTRPPEKIGDDIFIGGKHFVRKENPMADAAKPKFGAEHAAAWARAGFKEIAQVLPAFPNGSVQPVEEMGLYGNLSADKGGQQVAGPTVGNQSAAPAVNQQPVAPAVGQQPTAPVANQQPATPAVEQQPAASEPGSFQDRVDKLKAAAPEQRPQQEKDQEQGPER